MCITIESTSQFIKDLPLVHKSHILYVPIAPSGAGKSTFYEKIHKEHPHVKSFSLDSLRAKWYPSLTPMESWEKARKDVTFLPRVQKEFQKMVSNSSNIYLDATNLNPERRKFYIETAKKHGYLIIGILFSISMEQLIQNLDKREEKHQNGQRTPNADVQMHLDILSPPQQNEKFYLTYIINTKGNIEKNGNQLISSLFWGYIKPVAIPFHQFIKSCEMHLQKMTYILAYIEKDKIVR